MTKKALAEKAGMGISTLRYYMNVKYIDKLRNCLNFIYEFC